MNQKDEKKILVVDDDPDMLDSITLLLSKRGYIVTTAANAKEAMDNIKNESFSVVLTDIKMPGASGIELLEEINDLDPEMPVILMTAYTDMHLVMDAIKKGAFDFFTKPFGPDYLFHVVDKAISEYSLSMPMTSKEEKEVKQLEEAAAIAGGTETVLLADDEDNVREMTKKVLEQFGYSVIEAIDGEDALEKFRENRDIIQLAILDVKMPQKGGREVYEEIVKEQSGIKVLFQSDNTTEIINEKNIFEKEMNFISKPFTPKEFLRKVREVMDL